MWGRVAQPFGLPLAAGPAAATARPAPRPRPPLVVLNAPSGYGKSVLVGQWAERDPRPFPTLILGDEHNDPAMLIASIVAALDPIEPVRREVGVALANPEPSIEKVVLPRLGDSLQRRQVPFVLVLDDFERIDRRRAGRGDGARRRFPPAPSWSSRPGPSRSCRSASFASSARSPSWGPRTW